MQRYIETVQYKKSGNSFIYGEMMGKGAANRNRQARRLFFGYFIIITLILLWNLFHYTETVWETREAYLFSDSYVETENLNSASDDNTTIELTDNRTVCFRTSSDYDNTPSEKRYLRGVSILGYDNANSLRFINEQIRAEVIDLESGKVIGTGARKISEQMPNTVDESALYIGFSEKTSGVSTRPLEIRITSDGLTRNGIFFKGNNELSGDTETAFARLFYEKRAWNPVNSVLTFLAECTAGAVCLILYNLRIFPLMSSQRIKKSGKKSDRRNIIPVKIYTLIPLAIVIVFCMAFLAFTYLFSIKETASACSGEILVPEPEKKEIIEIRSGEYIRQAITPKQNELSGIGVRFSHENSDFILEWKLLDETGTTVLGKGKGKLSELKDVSSVFLKDGDGKELTESIGDYYLLSLDRTLKESAGKSFLFELSSVDAEVEMDHASESEKDTDRVQSSDEEEAERSVSICSSSYTNGDIELTSGAGIPAEMCMVALYRNNGFIRGMFARLSFFLILFIILLYVAALILDKDTAFLYLTCAVCMGMVFSFVTPAYSISDERTHIDSVYILSNKLLGITDEPGPQMTLKRSGDINASFKNTMPVTTARYRYVDENLFRHEDDRDLRIAYARNAQANVPLLCYFPAAVGFSVSRLAGMNMITMVMMGRWMNMLVCVGIICLAIRQMPFGGAAMAAISLFPKTLQQISSCSYDGTVIAVIFLFIALCMKAIFDEDKKISVVDVLLLMNSGFFIASCKGGAYIPVLGIALMIIPARAGRNNQQRHNWAGIVFTLIVCSAVLFFGKYIPIFAQMYFGRGNGEQSSAILREVYTVSDLARNPGKIILLMGNTIYRRGDGMIGEMVGKNLVQKWYFVYSFLFLALIGILPSDEEEKTFSWIQRFWILFLCGCGIGLIFLSMLFSFTKIGDTFIDGLQGRYFLPLSPLYIALFRNRRLCRRGIKDSYIIYSSFVLLVVAICEILLYYLLT